MAEPGSDITSKETAVAPAPAPADVPAAGPAPALDGPVQYDSMTAIPRPPGWKYRGFKIGKHELWYASPKVQLGMVAMVCFLCPGMFNALGGLGGGGQVDTTASNNANTALYAVFAVVGFFSGTFANRVGVKYTLSFGGIGYCIYAASFLSYNHNQNGGFVIFAGAFLGLCAGLLWTGQGMIMMAYPPEGSKGRYISWFWIIFNMGAVIGSLIPLGQNVNNSTGNVNDGTYVAFFVLMVIGAVLALLLCNAEDIQREDGSHVILMKNPSWWSEIKGLYETIYREPWIVLLFPMFFASNTFYTYQQNDFNAAAFTTRARALNSLLYWLSQIFGAVIFGYALDFSKVRRTYRAYAAFVALVVLTFAIWGGGWAWQKLQPERGNEPAEADKADWTSGGERYIGPMFLYMFYGFFDSSWQTCVYWYMGALSNSGRKAANYTGFYKGFQSAAASVFFRLDGLKIAYNAMFGATWGVTAGSLLIAAPVIFWKIKDHVTIEEDLKFSNETIEDVAPAAVLQEKKVDAGTV